MKAKVAQSLQN